jgi:hypothetical protein
LARVQFLLFLFELLLGISKFLIFAHGNFIEAAASDCLQTVLGDGEFLATNAMRIPISSPVSGL